MSVHSEDAHAERRYDFRPPERIKAPKSLKDPVLIAMAEKTQDSRGQSHLPQASLQRGAGPIRLRSGQAFGIVPSAGSGPRGKAALGFRQFMLRGLEKVSGEWNLVCLAYNLKRLHRLQWVSMAS